MRSIEGRIEMLEKREGTNREEILELLDKENLDVFERTRILYDAGLITGEMIAGWIKQGKESNS